MLEMDDLDRSLAEYNAEADNEAAKKRIDEAKQPRPLWQPSFPDEQDDDVEDEIKYTMQANRIYVIRDRLQRNLMGFQEQLKSVTTVQDRERNILLLEWFGTIVLVAILYGVLFFLKRDDFIVVFFCLIAAVTVFAIYQFGEILKLTSTFLLLSIKKRPSPFVERKRINTYLKREEYWEKKIDDIKVRQERLDILERKLEKNRSLSEKDSEEVENLGHIDQKPSVYTVDKFSVRDLWEYLTTKEKGGINSMKNS